MNSVKKTFVGVIVALLMVSCSANITEIVSDTDYPILPTTDVVDLSRAVLSSGSAFDGSIFLVNATGSTYPANYTGVSPLGASVATDGKVTINPTQYYQSSGDNSALLGVYPVAAATSWNASTGKVTYTIDGKTDIMATSFVTGNKSSAQPALTFSHLLTQILVKVYAQDATTIGLWGNVTGIAVAGRQPTCTLTLPAPGATGVVTSAFSGSVTDLPLTKSDGTAAPSLTVTATTQTAAQTFGYCMFAPVNSALTLKVTTAKGGTKEVAVPSNNFEKGKAYTIAVLLKSSSLAATANIGTWVDGTSGGPISSELQ